jgi:16S rRNA (uracil1498-N3)-methyltransferase
LNLFYNPSISESSKEAIFDKEESRHISKVLRKNAGDILHITNGKGFFFEVELLISDPKKCIACLIKSEKQPPLPYHLHLAVAPTKLNDRYEWFLEKATEIGISEITPIFCDHSERKTIKPERYKKIIESAMKQSLKAYLPTLNPAMSFTDFLEKDHFEEIKLIGHCETSKNQSLKSILQPDKSILILIGPEGDFSKREIERAKSQNFAAIHLGSSRLRTETAALAACHTVYLILDN